MFTVPLKKLLICSIPKERFLVEIQNSAKIFEYTDKRYIDIKIVLVSEFSALNITKYENRIRHNRRMIMQS